MEVKTQEWYTGFAKQAESLGLNKEETAELYKLSEFSEQMTDPAFRSGYEKQAGPIQALLAAVGAGAVGKGIYDGAKELTKSDEQREVDNFAKHIGQARSMNEAGILANNRAEAERARHMNRYINTGGSRNPYAYNA